MDQMSNPEQAPSDGALWEDERLGATFSDGAQDDTASLTATAAGPVPPPTRTASQRPFRAAGVLVAAALVLAFLSVILLQARSMYVAGDAHPIQPASVPPGPATAVAAGATATAPTTPTPPYAGPSRLRVTYSSTSTGSCGPGADSPYPYLSVQNTSADTPLQWHLSVSNPAYSLWQPQPNPILPGSIDTFVFFGPYHASAPLEVSIASNLGDWEGAVPLCSSVRLPTPVPTPTTPISPLATPTPIPVTITFTCAEGALNSYAQVCAHVVPRISVILASVYYDCSQSYEHLPNTLESFGVMPDANGNVTLSWTPTVQCAGSATAVVEGATDALGNGGLGRTSVTFPLL